MNANGWGVPQSDEGAYKWYSQAADSGFTTAQISLGKMYAIGFGAPLDPVEAHKWYNIAAMLDDYNAEFERDEIARLMSVEDIAKAEELAAAWMTSFKSAAE
jgi:TPR repeat protein